MKGHFLARCFGLGPALFLGLALCFPGLIAYSQSTSGRLAGTLRDPAGLAVVQAELSLTGAGGLALVSSSGVDGSFRFDHLPPGAYTLEAVHSGFARHRVEQINIDAARTTTLAPIVLALSERRESIDVQADFAQLEGEPGIATAVSKEQVRELPSIGRDPLPLINVEAGVVQNGQAFTAINGLRPSSATVTLDGVNIQDNYIRSNGLDFTPNRLRADQIGEFTVLLANGSAALSGASFVAFSTPQGGAQWRADVYWHNRNSALGANDWFNNRAGVEKPFLNRNQAGLATGGQLVKRRLYAYLNYEAERRRAAQGVNSVVLTEQARRGVFTYRDPRGRTQQLDLLRATGNAPDPFVASLLERTPDAGRINSFDLGDSSEDLLRNTATYRFNADNHLARDSVLARFDVPVSSRHLVSATYQFVRDEPDRPDLGVGLSARSPVRENSRVRFFSAGWRWAPAPGWSSEVRGGFNLNPVEFENLGSLDDTLFEGFAFTNPSANFEPEGRDTTFATIAANVAAVKGRHTFSTGGSLERSAAHAFSSEGLRPKFQIGESLVNPSGVSPEMFFGGVTAEDFLSAQNLLASLAGFVASGERTFNATSIDSGFVPGARFDRRFRRHRTAGYMQDVWRLHARATLTAGLRWEYFGRFGEASGLLLGPTAPDGDLARVLLSDATINFVGGSRPLYAPDRNDFAPSIGLAVDPLGDARTIFRAGYSLNYIDDQLMFAADRSTSVNEGLQATVRLQNLIGPISGGLPAIAAPAFAIPRTASAGLATNPLATISGIDPNLRSPYVQQWRASLQHKLTNDAMIELRYVGNHASKLLRGVDLNQLDIFLNGFLEDFRRARSNGALALSSLGDFDPQFNPSLLGSEHLKLFPALAAGGLLENSAVRSLIRSGEAGELAALYVVNGLADGSGVQFAPNPSTFDAQLLGNLSGSVYHALQAEFRARLPGGGSVQANYAFSKVLTDSSGTADRFDPYLDARNGRPERARADFDLSHAVKANFVWPVKLSGTKGRGLLSDWTLSGILTWQPGSPFSILSGRGTLNRRNRSGKNTAVSALRSLDGIVGFRQTTDGPFVVARSAIHPVDGTGVSGEGAAPFDGQAFTHPEPGAVGALQRRLFNGPVVFDLDIGLDRSVALSEARTLHLGARIANVLNRPTFFSGSHSIDSPQFGRLTSVLVGPRVVELYVRFSF